MTRKTVKRGCNFGVINQLNKDRLGTQFECTIGQCLDTRAKTTTWPYSILK